MEYGVKEVFQERRLGYDNFERRVSVSFAPENKLEYALEGRLVSLTCDVVRMVAPANDITEGALHHRSGPVWFQVGMEPMTVCSGKLKQMTLVQEGYEAEIAIASETQEGEASIPRILALQSAVA